MSMPSLYREIRRGALIALLVLAPSLALAAASASAIEADAAVVLPPGPFPAGDVWPGPSVRPWSALAVVALAPALMLWVGLALGRSRREDPFRERRVARRALRRLLGRMRSDEASPVSLERWRELTAALWRVGLAVPTADELAVCTTEPGIWHELWREAEEALYSPRHVLPAGWRDRAVAALNRVAPLPRLTWLPVRRDHWVPRLATLIVVLVVAGLQDSFAAVAGSDPDAAYQAGRYAEAATAWTRAAAQAPGDWALHHNAALAYAQSGQWGPAAGHWTAAWAVNRDNPAVHAGVLAGLAELDGVDPSLRRLLIGRPVERFAGRLPVAGWEALGLAGATAAALGLGLIVISLYTSFRPRWWLGAGVGFTLIGGAMAYSSVDAVRRHGVLADPLAAFVSETSDVRAVPSELMTNQQAATLFPGTVVIVDRTFLSWDHVITANGNEGWVRAESLIWLYGERRSEEISTVLRQRN